MFDKEEKHSFDQAYEQRDNLIDFVSKKHSPNLIAFVVLFYFTISLSVVFLDKFILSSAKYEFPYPLFITWYQLIVALVLLFALSELGKSYAPISFIPPYEFDPTIAVKVAPLTVIYVFMLAFNNLCLKYVEVTFYQVARSLSINFTILFTYVILRQKTSSSALFACFIVFMGFAIGSYREMNFSWAGIFYGIGSSAFVGLYSIYVKKSLSIVGNNQYRLLHYNTTLAILILGPIVLLSDEPNMIWDNVAFLDSASFWALMTFTGITGFGITVSICLQVKYTSALTNTISGTAKSCLQSILAAIVFKNTITPTNAIGIALAIVGSGYYSYVRYREMNSR